MRIEEQIKDKSQKIDIFQDPLEDPKEHWKPHPKEIECYEQIKRGEYKPLKFNLNAFQAYWAPWVTALMLTSYLSAKFH